MSANAVDNMLILINYQDRLGVSFALMLVVHRYRAHRAPAPAAAAAAGDDVI